MPKPLRTRLSQAKLRARVARARRRRPVCDDVAEWAARRGIESHTVLEKITCTLPLPRTIAPDVDALYAEHQTQYHRRRYVVPIDDARIIGRNGLVRLPDGSFAAEAGNGRPALEQDANYQRPRPRQMVRMPGSFVSLISTWPNNHYHWFHDVMLRFVSARDHVPPETRYLVPSTLTALQRESLLTIGLDESLLIVFDENQTWELERLHFMPMLTWSGHSRPEVVRIREEFRTALDVNPSAPTRRLYASRRDATRRRVLNDDDVEARLRAHGFETIECSALSLREQVETFASAAVVAAPHGAALTNILFASPGTTVIEFVDHERPESRPVFWTLAAQLGHEYWYLAADTVERPGMWKDTVVPLDGLDATLAQALR